MPTIQRVLLSVTDKTGLVDFAQGLSELGCELITADRRSNASAAVRFVPPRNNRYLVVVRAYAGSRPMQYRLITN